MWKVPGWSGGVFRWNRFSGGLGSYSWGSSCPPALRPGMLGPMPPTFKNGVKDGP